MCLRAEETFDPPTTPLDENGQGDPYAVYGFGAHLAEVEVDVELGTSRCCAIIAAHDVGRAINPTLVEGQIEGGIAQGLGLRADGRIPPGRSENLHDYLIPTFGDMPEIETILIEDAIAGRPVRRQGHWRAGADPDRARHPQRDPACDGRAHHARARQRPTASVRRLQAARGQRHERPRPKSSARASGRHSPLRCLSGAVPHQAAAAAGACDRYANHRRAIWSASIRMCCSTGRSRAAARRALPRRATTGTGNPCSRAIAFVTAHRRRHDLSRLQARPLHRLSRGRRRRHGHGRDRRHLQLLRRQGEDRHRPLSRPRDRGGARQGRAGRPCDDRRIWLADAGARRRPPSDRRLQEGGPRHLRDAARAVQRQGRSSSPSMAAPRSSSRPASRRSSTASPRSACGWAAARPPSACLPSSGIGKVDEVVVVDDHITGVLSEHQAGKLPRHAATPGIKIKGPALDARPLFPGGRARAPAGAGPISAIRSPSSRPFDAEGRPGRACAC